VGRRVKQDHRWAGEPGRLIAHDNPYDIWGKLDWEASKFAALKASSPPLDIDGIVYLLQNACISAVAAVEWLDQSGKRAAREAGREWDGAAFLRAVENTLPELPLARAIANTFKHGTYRDEGWGDAEIRLDVLFSSSQRAHLKELEGTEDFDAAYAEASAHADFRISFSRESRPETLDSGRFIAELKDGVLHLLDATYSDLDQYFVPLAT
jgi:hypothetical protein